MRPGCVLSCFVGDIRPLTTLFSQRLVVMVVVLLWSCFDMAVISLIIKFCSEERNKKIPKNTTNTIIGRVGSTKIDQKILCENPFRFALVNFETKVRFVRFASLFCSLRFLGEEKFSLRFAFSILFLARFICLSLIRIWQSS